MRNRQSTINNQQSTIRNATLLFSVVFLIFFVVPLCAEDVYLLEEGGIKVFFESPHEPIARELVEIYPGVRADLENIFGWDLNLTPSILLIRDTEQFQQMIQSPITVAFAVPEKNLIVIDYSKMSANTFSLRNIFKHELCHLLLHQHINRVTVPRWFNEGVAQWVSDGVGDIILDQKRSLLNKAAFGGRFIPLDSLDRGFPHREQDLILAYEESRSFVDHIIGKFGKEGIFEILRYMKKGEDMNAAVLRSFSIPFRDLEKGWHSALKRRMTWFTYLSYNLYEILFAFAALITIYAAIKLILRKRRLMKEMEEME
jgi:hypothetical protein